MKRVLKILAAAAFGIVSILLLVTTFSSGGAEPREFRTFLAVKVERTPDGKCPEPAHVLRVLPGAMELDGKAVTANEASGALGEAFQNQVNRVVFIDGDHLAAFGEVARAMTLLRDLRIEPAMLTPGLDRTKCLGVVRSSNRGGSGAVEDVPWWKFW